MDLLVVATAFAVIFPVELPDKTFVATLVLSTRYRPWPVWLGVAAAFLVQTTVAVVAGGLLTLLPAGPVLAVTAGLFALGCLLLLKGAGAADAEEQEQEREFEAHATPRAQGLRAAGASFLVLFVAEWGDLSQLFTAGLVARTEEPLSVFAGAWLALVTVAALAVLLGKALIRRVRLATIRRVGGVLCGVLALVTAYEALGELGVL